MNRSLQHRLKFRHLRVIDAILSHESLLQAALTLGVSQPALSKTLQEIESIIGARLFERHARGVTPNPHGLAVAESARRILTEVNRLEDQLQALDGGDGGLVVVGALPVTAAGLLPGALARFQAAHPNIEVQVTQERTEAILSALAQRQVDFVVGQMYEPAQPDSFVRQTLYDETISFVARADHPLFKGSTIELSDLAGLTVVLPTVSQRVGAEIDVFLESIGFKPHQPLRSSSIPLIRETLLSTDCIAVMPTVMLVADLVRGGLRQLPIEGPTPLARPAGLIRRSDAPLMRNAAVFVETFKRYVQDVTTALEA